jgi:hypothetical protein
MCALLVLALAACTAGSGDGPPSTSSASPTSSATPTAVPTYANALPGETLPVRPVDVLSDAGAEAFARYWVQALDWAYASLDTTLLVGASSPECSLCKGFIDQFANLNSKGRSLAGSRTTIRTLESFSAPEPNSRIILVVLTVGPLQVTEASGVEVQHADAVPLLQLNVRVKYELDVWQVADAKQVQS